MKYSVKELANLAHVTVKTLHHYHKLGLLMPSEISEAGYRYYGIEELKRLQEILFYKELDIPLAEIKGLMEDASNRMQTLEKQKELFLQKLDRYAKLLKTLNLSLDYSRKGENMDKHLLFKGFNTEEEWQTALEEQKNHLQKEYQVEFDTQTIEVEKMNQLAIEAKNYLNTMAASLRNGVKYNDPIVQKQVQNHLDFLNKHGHALSKEDYIQQTKFFLQDDFHRNMLESQQIGLAYYLVAVAKNL
ncbi:MerR family transcriptional regulator [Niallia sp. NCCP-28]|uniref:MerR family transcriptional regulator n=1 Tax=Niallia sp. NCCP-28 TaxID=2934712 RepID=UPI0020844C6B|nr:MerR family transcriptional regulator [Niallia sp. NCCP-28]GKU83052.1 MerR family transcriptional regulator [Niallia sp. NCCP-28]